MKKSLKLLYKIIPFKMELFKFLKIIWTPEESIYKHLYFKGIFKVKVEKTVFFKIKHYGYQLENELFWAGLIDGWEKESIKLWIQLCKQSSCIFDIGANTGVYSLIAKAVNSPAKVYAFEPVERVFDKLKENNRLNKFNIYTEKKAASNQDGVANIYDTMVDHVYSVTVNKNLNFPETIVTKTQIDTICLDTFIRQHNIGKVDLLKIDVETHEPEVLEGFFVNLKQSKPTLLIEVLNDEVGIRIEKLIANLDYLFFNINEKGAIRQVKTITKSDSFNFLLCSQSTAAKLSLI